MPDQVIKSRPVYAGLRRDPTGRRHLLLADGPEAVSGGLAPDVTAADFDERWTIVSHSRAIPSPDEGVSEHGFRSLPHLLAALRRRLGDERMGFRLYAVGAEPFLWTINALAGELGLGGAEIHLCAVGPQARRVFCNHCRTITEGVTTNVVTCAGCNASLFVRDHFSKRLNAFAGVQVDAESPGEIPDIEELYA